MKIINFDSIDSTNKYTADNLADLEDRTLITANEQIHGKGRNRNSWVSPANKNIYASYLIKTPQPLVIQTSWIGSLAALYTLGDAGLKDNLWIKWPNDIFYKNKKICGILSESVQPSPSNKTIGGIIIGIGININCSKKDFVNLTKPATSVYIETGKISEIKALIKILHSHLNSLYDQVLDKGIESLYKIWKKENKLIGKEIAVEKNTSEVLNIKVLDIEKTGAIIGVNKEGQLHKIYSGDVTVKKF